MTEFDADDLTQGNVPRDETPLADVTPPNEKLVHDFLLSTPENKYHPAALTKQVGDAIEQMPPTRATFKLPEVLGEFPPACIHRYMFVIHGAWEASEHFVDNSNHTGKRYVNPNYVHKARYSDALVRCDCGTLMVRDGVGGTRNDDLPHDDGVDDHADDCVKRWRLQARADLLGRRKEILEEMLLLGHSGAECYKRLGLGEQGTISHISKPIDLTVGEMKAEYQRRRKNTVVELLPVFTPDEIGAMYGLSKNTIRDVVASSELDASLKEFYDIREENRPDTEFKRNRPVGKTRAQPVP